MAEEIHGARIMINLILAVTMETVYQAIIKDLGMTEKELSRSTVYLIPRFPELCFHTLCDPEAVSRRLFP